MTSKKEIMSDLKFCKELMDRLIKYADNEYNPEHSYDSKHTVLQEDIVRLRRELMSVHHKLNWNYGWKE